MVIKFFCLTQLALNNERFNREAAIKLIDCICELCATHAFTVDGFGMVTWTDCDLFDDAMILNDAMYALSEISDSLGAEGYKGVAAVVGEYDSGEYNTSYILKPVFSQFLRDELTELREILVKNLEENPGVIKSNAITLHFFIDNYEDDADQRSGRPLRDGYLIEFEHGILKVTKMPAIIAGESKGNCIYYIAPSDEYNENTGWDQIVDDKGTTVADRLLLDIEAGNITPNGKIKIN